MAPKAKTLNRLNRFLGELKRRHVYQVAVGYSVSALAMVEAGDLVLPRLGFSEQAVTILLFAAMLGFPLAIVLAWAYDVTTEGIVPESATARVGGSSKVAPFAASAVTAVIVGGIGWWLLAGRATSPALGRDISVMGEIKSVAVLPLRDLSQAGDQEWLGQGLAEEIIGALSRVPDLHVVARQSSFALSDQTIAEIGERLAVTHVLSGSVSTRGNSARITARLVEVAGERIIWTRDFQPELGRVRDAQELIARAVVSSLELELGTISGSGLMSASTTDPVAHENYLRGLQLWDRRSGPEILSAIAHFRRAVDIDSAYAAAWAGLSYAYLVLPEYSPTADVGHVREQSAVAAAQALEIDAEQTDALTAMGWGRMVHEYDWDRAEGLIGQALTLDSTNVNALHWQSHVISWQGRPTQALALARAATSLDPLSSIMRANMAYILMEAREYEDALREVEQILGLEPNFDASYRIMWNINTRMGRIPEASQALETWMTRTGRDAGAARELAAEFARAAEDFRQTGRSNQLSKDLLGRLQLGLAIEGQLHASVGDVENTLAVLQQAYRERAGARSLLSVRVNPLYDFIREEERFLELVRRIGLGADPGMP